MAMRLDKFLSAAGAGTRSEVKKLIKSGIVTVNDIPAKRPEQPVDADTDRICLKGRQLLYEKYIYYILYKQKGCVTAVTDATHKTVMDDFPADLKKRLAPVGRLDLDTEGLLLLTDDGAFAHHILSPSHHVEKTYEAVLDAPVPQTAVADFAKGIEIGDDTPTLPARLTILPQEFSEDGAPVFRAQLTIREGRYHQVKRMFSAVGCRVVELKRLSIGTLTLQGLAPGCYRKLSPAEIEELRG
jgi:16S rRNA pseudouridine516 synthase